MTQMEYQTLVTMESMIDHLMEIVKELEKRVGDLEISVALLERDVNGLG